MAEYTYLDPNWDYQVSQGYASGNPWGPGTPYQTEESYHQNLARRINNSTGAIEYSLGRNPDGSTKWVPEEVYGEYSRSIPNETFMGGLKQALPGMLAAWAPGIAGLSGLGPFAEGGALATGGTELGAGGGVLSGAEGILSADQVALQALQSGLTNTITSGLTSAADLTTTLGTVALSASDLASVASAAGITATQAGSLIA